MADNKLVRRDLLKVLCASSAVCGIGCGGVDEIVGKDEFTKLPAIIAGVVKISIEDFPALMEPGGGLVGTVEGMKDPVAITHETEGTFMAMPAMCTHMTCVLRWNRLNSTLDCPCHGSSFELDGTVLNGPATRSLTRYETRFDAVAKTLDIKLT